MRRVRREVVDIEYRPGTAKGIMEVRNASAKSGSIGLVECPAMIRPQHATPSPGDKAFFGHKRGWGWDRPKDDDGDVDLRTLDWRRGAAVTP
jgi:hypothetical protein